MRAQAPSSSDLRGCRRSEGLGWAEDCDKRFSKTCSWAWLGLGTFQWMFRKKTERLVATSMELCCRAVWAAACVQGCPTPLRFQQALCCLGAFAQTVSPSWTSLPPEASPQKPLARKCAWCAVSRWDLPPLLCQSSDFCSVTITWLHILRLGVYCCILSVWPFPVSVVTCKEKMLESHLAPPSVASSLMLPFPSPPPQLLGLCCPM